MIEIKNVNGHYEAWENEKFIVSGDTKSEVEKELKEMEIDGWQSGNNMV